MKTEIEKFLEFNGKNILFLSIDGNWWVAIKPICDAIGVNYDRQYRNLTSSKLFGDACANQHMHDSAGRLQKMVSLPEKYVYGWLMSINSKNEDLIKYQKECCDILYEHFHGAISSRTGLLKEKTTQQIEIERLEAELAENPIYQQIQDLKRGKLATNKALRVNDSEIIKNQLPLWTSLKEN